MDNYIEFLKYYNCKYKTRIYRQLSIKDKSGNISTPVVDITENASEELIKYYNETLQEDIYFLPNTIKSKSRKSNNVMLFNSFFVDCDASKDGKYLSTEEVNKYKFNIIDKLNKLDKLTPTFIIETRNGLQIHWLIKHEDKIYINESLWTKVQNVLVKYFDADEHATDPVRLLRLPFTLWQKQWKNHGFKPFMTSIVSFNDIKYNLNNFIESVDKLCNRGEQFIRSIYIYTSKLDCSAQLRQANQEPSNINDSRDCLPVDNFKDVNNLFTIRKKYPVKTFYSDKEAKEYIKRNINIGEFFNIDNPSSFNCIFHDDKNPSAFISKPSDKNKYYMYVCRGNCNFKKGDIFHCVQKYYNISFFQAKKLLYDVYNIKIEKTPYKRIQYELINNNQQFIYTDELKDILPDTYNLINKYNCMPILYYIFTACSVSFLKPIRTSVDKEVLFSFSQRHLQKHLKISRLENVNKRIALLTYLGFIKKIDDNKLSYKTLLSAKKLSYVDNNYKETIQFYSLPLYDADWLNTVFKRTKDWKENHCTIKGLSRDMILRTFGKEEADRVYPKLKNNKPIKANTAFKNKILKVIRQELDKKGWIQEKEILNLLKGNKYIKEVKEKTVLPEILFSNKDISLIYLNKRIKEKLNINLNYRSKILVYTSILS